MTSQRQNEQLRKGDTARLVRVGGTGRRLTTDQRVRLAGALARLLRASLDAPRVSAPAAPLDRAA